MSRGRAAISASRTSWFRRRATSRARAPAPAGAARRTCAARARERARRRRGGRRETHAQRRPQHLRHPRVQLEEGAAGRARHILHGGEERAAVGQQEGTRLHHQAQAAARLRGKGQERVAHRRANTTQVRSRLVRHASHLVAAAQVERLHARKGAAQVQRQTRHALPDGRIGAGADVRVDAHNLGRAWARRASARAGDAP